MEKVYALILGVLFVIVVVCIIVLICVGGNQKPYDFDKHIDIILIDRGRQRTIFQIERIDRYMKWVNTIIVVAVDNNNPKNKADKLPKIESAIPVIHVQSDKKELEAILMEIREKYEPISENILFLGDTTFPSRCFSPEHLFSVSRKRRMFNYIQPDASMAGLSQFFEKTIPVLLFTLLPLEQSTSLDNYILSQSLSNELVYSPWINQSLILLDNQYTDDHQLNTKQSKLCEYFLTIFISPLLTNDVQQKLNTKVISFLS
jgi:hypothetical protein